MTEICNLPYYVLLVFEDRYLFIPQDDVYLVELITDVQKISNSIGPIGYFLGYGLKSPVFCLAEDLSLLLEVPKNHEFIVLLKAEPQPLGVSCEMVETIDFKQKGLRPQDLPTLMKRPKSPLSQLLIYQDKIGCVCEGIALVNYLNWQAERFTLET